MKARIFQVGSSVGRRPQQQHAQGNHAAGFCVIALRGFTLRLALLGGLMAGSVHADVSVLDLAASGNDVDAEHGAGCWHLPADGPEGAPEGAPASASGPGAELFCPECLNNPAYDAQVPLKRIEQRLIPKLAEEGDYTCEGRCQRWLLRPPATKGLALMLVRVGVPTLCGSTGWCPGRIYERRQGVWNLVGSYNSNEVDTLCLLEQTPGRLKMLLHVNSEPLDALELDWRY